MDSEQHRDGLDQINRAISAAIHPRRASVSFAVHGPATAPGAIFEVKVGDTEVRQVFTYEEIVDSHKTLTTAVAMKVRHLAAEVARLPIMSDVFN